jgi:hypothetical protein
LFSGSFDKKIRCWNINDMKRRITERSIMLSEDLYSKKHDAWYNALFKKKSKVGKSKKKK